MKVVLDVTRTLAHRFNAHPTGIDRVEFEYARRLLDRTAYPDVGFLVTTPYGHALMPRHAMEAIIAEISLRWRGAGSGSELFYLLRDVLEQPIDLGRIRIQRFENGSPTGMAGAYLRLFAISLRWRSRFRKMLRSARAKPVLYVHTSHQQLDKLALFAWTRRAGVSAVFMVHDLIPISHPEFCGIKTSRRHPLRMRTVAQLASSVLVNSQCTGLALGSYLEANSLPRPPIVPAHLGSSVDLHTALPVSPRSQVSYFVCVGTIEGRKNLSFLFNVWRTMIRQVKPEAVPRLVICGRRGWQCRDVLDVLDKSRELAPYIIEASGLGDNEIASLLDGACGVLAPSLVEGFGMPTVEAISRGIPVVASDIPAHREILRDHAILCGNADGPSWISAIRSLQLDEGFRNDRIERTRNFRRTSWERHVDDAIARAIEIARRPRRAGYPPTHAAEA